MTMLTRTNVVAAMAALALGVASPPWLVGEAGPAKGSGHPSSHVEVGDLELYGT